MSWRVVALSLTIHSTTLIPNASDNVGYKTRGRGQKAAFSNKTLQISDGGDFECSKFQFCP